MLRSLRSREITEWMAYERVAGPLDDSYRDEVLRLILLSNAAEGAQYPSPAEWFNAKYPLAAQ